MGPDLNGKILFTYQGDKWKNAKFDDGEGMTSQRLFNWGMYNDKNPAQLIGRKDLFALAQQADKNQDGQVTYGELDKIENFKDYKMNLNPDSRYAKTIFGLQNSSKFDAENYIREVRSFDKIAAKSLSTDPEIKEVIKPEYNYPFVSAMQDGKMKDMDALKKALGTNDPVIDSLIDTGKIKLGDGNHDLQPICYSSQELGARVIIVPTDNGFPYDGGEADGARAFTKDSKTGFYKELQIDSGHFKVSKENKPVGQAMYKYLDENLK